MDDDLSRAITPAMLEELEASRRWIGACAFVAFVAAAALATWGSLSVMNGLRGATTAARVSGWGAGVAQLIATAMLLMLVAHLRQHRQAIAATHGRLTETKFIAVVDSQRRIFRFLAIVFPAAGLAALAAMFLGSAP